MPRSDSPLTDTIRFLWKGSLYAAATALVCGIAAFLVTSAQVPSFRASAQLYATDSARGLTPFAYSPAKLDAVAYGFAAVTDGVLAAASDQLAELGLGSHGIRSLRNSLHIGTEETSSASFVEIASTAGSAALAAAISNSVASALVEWDAARARSELVRVAAVLETQIESIDEDAARLSDGSDSEQLAAVRQLRFDQNRQLSFVRALESQSLGTIEIFEYATLPSGPSGPRVLINTALAAVLGLIAGYGVILVVDSIRPARTASTSRGRS